MHLQLIPLAHSLSSKEETLGHNSRKSLDEEVIASLFLNLAEILSK
jgi:hypothetical protein